MASPLPLNVALQLKQVKKDQKLSYADLGKQIGLSGTMLSARIVHCEQNPDNKKPLSLSSQSLALIHSFLNTQGEVRLKAKEPLDGIETATLITELKRRGASSIVF